LQESRRPEPGAVQEFAIPEEGASGAESSLWRGGRLRRVITSPLRRGVAEADKLRQSPERYGDQTSRSAAARTWLLNNGWEVRIEERQDVPSMPEPTFNALGRPSLWFWVDLVSSEDPNCVFPDFSSAFSKEEAIIHAQERYVLEAKHGSGPAAARG
jgi:hypothetical protein